MKKPVFKFSKDPASVPPVESLFRRIKTSIPVPESIEILDELERYESRSMHGQIPVVWDKAEGFSVWDKWGNRWIDFTSTIFVANTGHGHPHIIQSIKKYLDRPLIHSYTFATGIRAEYLKKLMEVSPPCIQKAFLVSSGTEATETAIKLMRMYGRKKNPGRLGIISFKGAMHGRTLGAEMLKGDPGSGAWIGYQDPNIHHLPFPAPWTEKEPESADWAARFREDIGELLKSKVELKHISGIILESYVGWGAIFYPEAYVKELVKFAKENDILVVYDEIQAGFGRTGRFFAYEHYGVEPDLVCMGKGMSSSLPLAGIAGREDIMDLPEIGSMSSTHSANPLGCAAGLANLEILERENLVKESERKGRILHEKLEALKHQFPKRISYTFGKGLLGAVLTRHPVTGAPDPMFGGLVCERAVRKGLLPVFTGRESIKIGPPLTIPDEALLEGLEVLREAITEVDREEKGES